MNLTIKDVPPRLHKKLKARAQENKRSLNWEVIDILEATVEQRAITVTELLKGVREVHARINIPTLTEEFLREAKSAGRP
jgi:plasmid stability protein